MDFLTLAKSRCTTRGFTDKKIAGEDLERILEAGRVAPTACNKQPQRIIVVQDPENLRRVQKAYQTFGSPCVLLVCQDKSDPLVRPFDGKGSGDLDIGIVCDHMMLAARELGIGSVMVGLFDPAIIRAEFGVPETVEPTALLLLGYPAQAFLSPERHQAERKPIGDMVMYERYRERGGLEMSLTNDKKRVPLLVDEALKRGALEAKMISARSVVTAPWVRLKCTYGCDGFGTSHCCPPETPTPKETQEILDCYTSALLVHFDGKTRPTRVIVELERSAFLAGYYKAFGFGAGPCLLCKTCNTEECVHREKARPAMEACGIDVYATARNNGFPIDVLSGESCEENYYGLLLLE